MPNELIDLSPKRKERIRDLLRKIRTADATLQEKREQIAEYMRLFEAEPRGTKTFPFVGASNVPIPMVAIAKDAIKARIANALLGQDQDLNVEPITEDNLPFPIPGSEDEDFTWRDVSEAYEQYIHYETGPNGQIPFRDFVEDVVEDIILVGTSFPTAAWSRRVEFDWTAGEIVPVNTFNNVELRSPSLDKVVFPHGYSTYDRMPFITEKYPIRPSEMLARIDSAGWTESHVRSFLKEHGQPQELSYFDQERDEIEETDHDILYQAPEMWMGETWARLDLDGSGREVKVLIDHSINKEGDPEVFRVMPWPYEHRKPKWAGPVRYEYRKDRLLGRGIAEIGKGMNEAINAVINQLIDRGTLSNTLLLGVDENTVSLSDLRNWRPGDPIPRGDDPNAINEMRIGDATPGLFEVSNILMMLFEKLVKVSDYDLGREAEQIGQQGTATATLALLQQSGQFYDPIIRNVRRTMNEIGYMMLSLHAQYKPRKRMISCLGPKQAELVLRAFELSPEQLSERLGVYIAFSKDATSRELQHQREVAKLQMVDAYYDKLMLFADAYVAQPHKRDLIRQIAKDGHLRMRKVLESLGESYSNRTLPDFDTIIRESLERFAQVADVMTMKQGGVPGMSAPPEAEAGQPAGEGGPNA